MKLRTPHDLLVYLVSLSDSDRSSTLLSGEYVVQAAKEDGLIEWDEHDLDRFAEFFFALRDDDSITFTDNGAPVRGPHRRVSFNDVHIASEIRVRSHGRLAAQTSRPNVSIGQLALGNINNLDLTLLIGEIERAVDDSGADEDTKREARSRLDALRERAADVGTGAAGDLISTALRQVLGLG